MNLMNGSFFFTRLGYFIRPVIFKRKTSYVNDTVSFPHFFFINKKKRKYNNLKYDRSSERCKDMCSVPVNQLRTVLEEERKKKIIASHHLNVALAAIDNFYRSSATRHGR